MPEVGKWTCHEARVLIVFLLTAVAWMTRSEPFGGWKTWFGVPGATDASVALVAVIVMFLAPNGRGGRLLDWDTASSIPWGILILFGGGIAIAKAFMASRAKRRSWRGALRYWRSAHRLDTGRYLPCDYFSH